DAVTNDKLADNAVTSANIVDGTIATADLANNAVTENKISGGAVAPEKLSADPADEGKVGVVQPDGTVVYQNLDSENIDGKDLTATTGDNSITVTNGTGTTLVNTQLHVTDGGITTAKLANDAVTSAKIEDGTVATVDLANNAVTGAKIGDDAVTARTIN